MIWDRVVLHPALNRQHLTTFHTIRCGVSHIPSFTYIFWICTAQLKELVLAYHCNESHSQFIQVHCWHLEIQKQRCPAGFEAKYHSLSLHQYTRISMRQLVLQPKSLQVRCLASKHDCDPYTTGISDM